MAAVGLRERLQERAGYGKFLKDFVGVVLASVVDDYEPGIGISISLNNRIPVVNKLPDIVFFIVRGDYYIKGVSPFRLGRLVDGHLIYHFQGNRTKPAPPQQRRHPQ